MTTITLYVSVFQYVGVYYYTIGNLPPELRSTYRSIQLIACVQPPDLKKYGHSKILKPFIKDVNTLYNVSEAVVNE